MQTQELFNKFPLSDRLDFVGTETKLADWLRVQKYQSPGL